MSDGPEWFAPKRFGYGSGLPIAWQGWVLLIGFLVLTLAAALLLANRPVALIAVLAPATILFMIVCARTTRGGWHWRSGSDD
ncbi:hypothetical protein [Sphingomonas sp.]|uniref:hypothetical protein n=1 Tax=Sphingomonas sp. TaxID=28214 RepID=UPI0025DDD0FA|nr:hypothetical protein [Sphingomonas sp.]